MNTNRTTKRNTPSIKTTIFTVVMILAIAFSAMSVSPAAAQGETPTQVGATLVFDAQDVAPAEMPADATAAKFAQMTLFTTVDGKVAESGEAVWYDLSVANAYPDMIKQYVSGTVSFWDSAPSGTQSVNVAPAPKTVTIDVSWFQPVIDLLDKLSLMLKDMMNSNGAPYVAPPVATEAPAAATDEAPAATTGLVDMTSHKIGDKFYPVEGVTLTYSGVGNLCSVEASVSWLLPTGASVDISGHKYFSNTPVPAAVGTFQDCHRMNEIKLYVPDANSTPMPSTVPACTKADIEKLPGVKSVVIEDSANGKLTVTFSGPFTVSAFYGDWVFYGAKYTVDNVGVTLPAKDNDTANLYLRQECMPAK